MLNITVCGAAGKMGRMITAKVLTEEDTALVGAIESKGNNAIGRKVGDIKITDNLEAVLKNTDMVIEFTNPEATLEHLKSVLKSRKAMVIGTTGIPDEGIKEIEEAAKEIPIVFAPNMSLGVNLLFEITEAVAGVLSSYDIEIVEAHHSQKKDAPSGTALKLAEVISKKLKLTPVYGRHGNVGPRKNEIGIHAIRAGDIAGEHTVIFAGPGERIELTHRARSRETLVAGAVKAAKWLANKKPKLYSMKNVLGI
ncbi:MAG: 4-hydroxy-tetrahydrodipicolinate reductase [Elusimicrobia bacterium]|nr:4-hydroxy-tetrahydrodipicolinate reductase [Elusimicrobiota bacterium]